MLTNTAHFSVATISRGVDAFFLSMCHELLWPSRPPSPSTAMPNYYILHPSLKASFNAKPPHNKLSVMHFLFRDHLGPFQLPAFLRYCGWWRIVRRGRSNEKILVSTIHSNRMSAAWHNTNVYTHWICRQIKLNQLCYWNIREPWQACWIFHTSRTVCVFAPCVWATRFQHQSLGRIKATVHN